VSEGLPADFNQCFQDMVGLLRKVETWWIAEVWIWADPDYDGSQVDKGEVVPGSVLLLELLASMALGNEHSGGPGYHEVR